MQQTKAGADFFFQANQSLLKESKAAWECQNVGRFVFKNKWPFEKTSFRLLSESDMNNNLGVF